MVPVMMQWTMPNAGPQAPPIAGARHERRLLTVACRPLLGREGPPPQRMDIWSCSLVFAARGMLSLPGVPVYHGVESGTLRGAEAGPAGVGHRNQLRLIDLRIWQPEDLGRLFLEQQV